MKVTLLGTGTSTGVPLITCECPICTSRDSKDKRLRASALVQTKHTNLLIDTGPDLRAQLLRAKVKSVDAVFFTHTHADHLMGLDDLRPLSFKRDSKIKVYGDENSLAEVRRLFSYTFNGNPNYLGSPPPKLELIEVEPGSCIQIEDIELQTIPVKHGKWDVLGLRVGDFAYITDCSEIPEASWKLLEGVKHLVLDGLRDRPHPTHFSFSQAVEAAKRLGAENTSLTHLSHEISHEDGNRLLREKYGAEHVQLGWDGQQIKL